MDHKVRYIAEVHEEFSLRRKEENPFNAEKFLEFAETNKNKYRLITIHGELFVSTWYSNDLIKDFKSTL